MLTGAPALSAVYDNEALSVIRSAPKVKDSGKSVPDVWSVLWPWKSTNKQLRWTGIVINLDRRKQRMNYFISRISSQPALQGKFCRMSGTDGHIEAQMADVLRKKHIMPAAMQVARLRDSTRSYTNGINLTLGSIGCYESHIRAMEIVAKTPEIDFGIVAEDDLSFFSPDFEQQFDKLVNDSRGEATALWNSTDLIYLQSCTQGWRRDRKVEPRLQIPTRLHDVSHEHAYCLGMYAVSKSAAKMLSAVDGPMLPMVKQIDHVLPLGVGHIRAKAFYPSIAQVPGPDEIGTDTQILQEVGPSTWLDC